MFNKQHYAVSEKVKFVCVELELPSTVEGTTAYVYFNVFTKKIETIY